MTATLLLLTATSFLPAQSADAPLVLYEVSLDAPSTQMVGITMTVPCAGEESVDVMLPTWRPGRYSILDPVATVRGVRAVDAEYASEPRVEGRKPPPAAALATSLARSSLLSSLLADSGGDGASPGVEVRARRRGVPSVGGGGGGLAFDRGLDRRGGFGSREPKSMRSPKPTGSSTAAGRSPSRRNGRSGPAPTLPGTFSGMSASSASS